LIHQKWNALQFMFTIELCIYPWTVMADAIVVSLTVSSTSHISVTQTSLPLLTALV